MPRDLFVVSSPGVPSRRSARLLPISIALHVLAIGALIVVPLLAVGELPPVPEKRIVPMMMAKPVVPAVEQPGPRPPRQARRQTPEPPTLPTPAPPPISTEAPTGLPDVNVADTVPDWFSSGSQGTPDWLGMPGGGSGLGSEPGTGTGPASDEPVRPGGVIERPRRVKDVAPEYPRLARDVRLEGTVVIDAIIGQDGRVRQATVRSSPSKLLEDAALAAVRQWEYQPTRLNGVPVAVIMTVEVHFKLSP